MARLGNIKLTAGLQLNQFITNLSYNELVELSSRVSLPTNSIIICALNNSTDDDIEEDKCYRFSITDSEGNIAAITQYDVLGNGSGLSYGLDTDGNTLLKVNFGNGLYIDGNNNVCINSSYLSGLIGSSIKVMQDAIKSDVYNLLSGTYSEVLLMSDQIKSTVSELSGNVYSLIIQSTRNIKSEVVDKINNSYSLINQTAEDISLKVSLLSGEMMSYIRIIASGIIANVIDSKGYATTEWTANQINSKVSDLSGLTYSLIQQTVSDITLSINALSGNVLSKFEVLSGSINSKVNDLSGNYSSIQQTVSGVTILVNTLSGDVLSKFEVLSGSINSKVNDLSGNYSTIDQTVSGIALSINSLSATVAGIDINPSGVTVFGDQIVLSGHAMNFEADELTINSDNFKLSGSSVIMQGEINASSFNVINENLQPVITFTTYHSEELGTSSETIEEGMPVFIISYNGNRYILNPIKLTGGSSSEVYIYARKVLNVTTKAITTNTNSDNYTIYKSGDGTTYSINKNGAYGSYYTSEKILALVPVFANNSYSLWEYNGAYVYSYVNKYIYKITEYNISETSGSIQGVFYVFPKVQVTTYNNYYVSNYVTNTCFIARSYDILSGVQSFVGTSDNNDFLTPYSSNVKCKGFSINNFDYTSGSIVNNETYITNISDLFNSDAISGSLDNTNSISLSSAPEQLPV